MSPAIQSDSIVADNVLEATRPVREIVADGARVAIQYEPGSRPGGLLRRTETWNTASNSVVRFESFIGAIALAGDRLVKLRPGFGIWISADDDPAGGPVQGVCLPSPVGCEGDGPAIGDVIGKGSLIVYDSWKRLQATCGDSCPDRSATVASFASMTEARPSRGEQRRADTARRRQRSHPRRSRSGDAREPRCQRAEHVKIVVPGFTQATLQGPHLVVHSGETVADYDATSGVLLHAWHVPADATLQDVQDGVAVYVTSSDIHLLRLGDGHDSVITPPGTGPLHAQLESAGLFYSYSTPDADRPGRVAFVPSANLP